METTTSINVETLKALGTEWTKNEMHRIYFNDLADLYGLKLHFYNSGNISSATLDGDKVSNSAARELASILDSAKVWFDVKTGQFQAKGINASTLDKIIAAITERASK